MATQAAGSNYRNIVKANEAQRIASKGLYKFVLKSFEKFIETTKCIDDGTIKRHHRKGKPAFTNSPEKDFKDPFQICKCYMPYGNSKHNSVSEADFYVLITVIYNFLPFKERLAEALYIKVRKNAKLIHDHGRETSPMFVLTGEGLLEYVDLLIQLLDALKHVDQEDMAISDADEKLKKMRRSLEPSKVPGKGGEPCSKKMSTETEADMSVDKDSTKTQTNKDKNSFSVVSCKCSCHGKLELLKEDISKLELQIKLLKEKLG